MAKNCLKFCLLLVIGLVIYAINPLLLIAFSGLIMLIIFMKREKKSDKNGEKES